MNISIKYNCIYVIEYNDNKNYTYELTYVNKVKQELKKNIYIKYNIYLCTYTNK